ncbi:XRE family transcriptional regulator [Streptomyces winkii]|uniref:XRE family transcriptional regulator n=1 Tax=Streptomyces winkii TaxID=3051178 RepID=UPI0028D01085|nr:XRE family transcriptional regulator [Streptomyces sp. DSM 40971]
MADDIVRGALATKLDHLFSAVRPADGDEFTYDEVAEAIKAQGGPTISSTYLWQLRKGLRDNPTKRHLEALATFFGIPAAYFFDDAQAERIDAELALLSALREAPVRHIALRARGLSPKSLEAISDMVDRVRELEGLPEPPDDADR